MKDSSAYTSVFYDTWEFPWRIHHRDSDMFWQVLTDFLVENAGKIHVAETAVFHTYLGVSHVKDGELD